MTVPEIIDQEKMRGTQFSRAYLDGTILRHSKFQYGARRSKTVTVYRLRTSERDVFRVIQRDYLASTWAEVEQKSHDLYAGVDEKTALRKFAQVAARHAEKGDEEIKGEMFREPAKVVDAMRHLMPLAAQSQFDSIITVLWSQVVRRLFPIQDDSDRPPAALRKPPTAPLPDEAWAFFHDLVNSPIRIHRLQAAYVRAHLRAAAPSGRKSKPGVHGL